MFLSTCRNFNNSFHWEKKTGNKTTPFPVDKSLVPTTWNKGLIENYVSVEE